MRNDFFVRRDFAFGINSSQLSGGFEESLRVKIVCPFQMNCPRDRTPSLGSHNLTGIFCIASCVHDDGGGPMQFLKDILDGGNPLTPWFHPEIAGLGNDRLLRDGKTRVAPGIEAAVQHMDSVVPEEFQKPEQPRRAHSRNVVIDDNVAVVVHPFSLDQMFDHP